jgi:hypothetical protein
MERKDGMVSKQVLIGYLSTGLAALAVVAFLAIAPQPVCADDPGCSCDYAGSSYSHGSCIDSVCSEGQVQQCKKGNWTGCRLGCPDLDPCEAL